MAIALWHHCITCVNKLLRRVCHLLDEKLVSHDSPSPFNGHFPDKLGLASSSYRLQLSFSACFTSKPQTGWPSCRPTMPKCWRKVRAVIFPWSTDPAVDTMLPYRAALQSQYPENVFSYHILSCCKTRSAVRHEFHSSNGAMQNNRDITLNTKSWQVLVK